MIFKSDIVEAHWDNWCHYHEGTYYLYYLITERSPGEGFGLATSNDGVHWEDHGWVVRESDKNLKYLGTGAVWKDPNFEETGRFICNYSEHREEANGKVTQNILFAWSTDLIHWNKFDEEYMFRVDDRFYDKYGRWDCIFPMQRAEGGYWGTWTATAHPDSEVKGIVGIGYSEDGVTWTALEPPVVEPGVGESGAFYRFGDRIYTMFGAGGMWNYSAEKVTGPYIREKKNDLLLQRGHSYFSRYFPTSQGVLVNHQVMSGKRNEKGRVITYVAPLKQVEIDAEGIQRWKYWMGNEALKGEPVELDVKGTLPRVVIMTDQLDITQGVISEGTLRLPNSVDDQPAGLYLYIDSGGYAVQVNSDGVVEMGLMDLFSDSLEVKHTANREWSFNETVSFRMLVRRGMLEFYMDDHFMECWTMECPDAMSIRLGVIGDPQDSPVRDLNIWRMSLQRKPEPTSQDNAGIAS